MGEIVTSLLNLDIPKCGEDKREVFWRLQITTHISISMNLVGMEVIIYRLHGLEARCWP